MPFKTTDIPEANSTHWLITTSIAMLIKTARGACFYVATRSSFKPVQYMHGLQEALSLEPNISPALQFMWIA